MILTEVPEMFGAEQQLMNRVVSEAVFRDLATMINDFKQYFFDHGQPVYENPPLGNKAVGLTTLEKKSLGAVQKGGATVLLFTAGRGTPLGFLVPTVKVASARSRSGKTESCSR